MTLRFKLSVLFVTILLLLVGLDFAFSLLNQPSDLSVSLGVGVIVALFIFAPKLIAEIFRRKAKQHENKPDPYSTPGGRGPLAGNR